MKQKIAIWGTGKLAKKFYFLYKNQFDICCFFDNDEKKHGTYLDDIPIQKWTSSNPYKIVIASMYWKEIAEQLQEYGLVPIKDYLLYNHITGNETIYYSELYELTKSYHGIIDYHHLLSGKKIAVVYGNCQTSLIETALTLCKQFSKEYTIIKIPKVCDYVNCKELVEYFVQDDMFWDRIDLFIYQTVAEDNRFYSGLCTDQLLLQKLNADSEKINIVNIYFDGYFPQMIKNQNSPPKEIHQSGLFPFGDKYIDDLLEKQKQPQEIVRIISEEDFISEEEIFGMVEKSFCELESSVFCKTFLQKLAKHFCRLLQLHFVGSCNNCSFLLNVSNANIFFIIQINIVILLSA